MKKTLSIYDEFLCDYFRKFYYVKLLDDMAYDLTMAGYVSKSGRTLTESHISNFARKDLGMRKTRRYSKPTYQGRNWITG